MFITADQAIYIGDLLTGHADVRAELLQKFGAVQKIKAKFYAKVIETIKEMTGEE